MLPFDDRYLRRRIKIWAFKYQPPVGGKARLLQEAFLFPPRKLLNYPDRLFSEFIRTNPFDSYRFNNSYFVGPMIHNFQTVALNLRLL